MFDIQEELKKLPGKPGVYIMHDEKDAIIYVGKAVSLKKPGAAVFSGQQEQGSQDRSDGDQDSAFLSIL